MALMMSRKKSGGGTAEFLGGFNTYTSAGSGAVTLSKIPKKAVVVLSGAVWRSGTPSLSTSDATLTKLGQYPANFVDGYSYSVAYLAENITNNTLNFTIVSGGATPAICVTSIE